MTDNLSKQTAFITGMARGLGLQIAEDLAKEGVHIIGTDIREDLLEKQLERIGQEYNVDTLALVTDVSNDKQVIAAVQQAYEKFSQIDILINNAGIRKVGPVYEMETEIWDEIHSINLKGQFLCTREVLKQGMLKANQGTLIFISSGSGKRGEKNSSVYCASKFGVTGFAQSVARDLKETNIRVSTIFPGMVWTPMAEESEVAHLDLDWLASEQVSKAIVSAIKHDPETIIPEVIVYHRAQI